MLMEMKGNFLKFLWRDERSGHSIFVLETKNEGGVLPPFFYSQKRVGQNNRGITEVWYQIVIDALNCPIVRLLPNTPIKVSGNFSMVMKYKSHSFVARTITTEKNDADLAVRYLCEHMQPQYADTIVERYGNDVFLYGEDPEIRKGIANIIGTDEAEKLFKEMSETMEEQKLYQMIGQAGISYGTCAHAIKLFGRDARMKLADDPYETGRLLNLSFDQMEKMAAYLRVDLSAPCRVRAIVDEALARLRGNGSTWWSTADFNKMLERASAGVGAYEGKMVPPIAFYPYIQKKVGVSNAPVMYYEKKLKNAEDRIFENIGRLASVQDRAPFTEDLIDYAEQECHMHYGVQQRAAFPNTLTSGGIKILTGGPGTGKTTTLKGIILAYKKMFPEAIVKLCAPTGRAAQRMSESTGMPATTVHRLLEYRPYGSDVSHKDKTNPIDAHLVVVDEMSMMDVELFDIFLEAIKTGTTLLLVGDIHQLESVGPGAVLRDLLETTNIKHTMLTEVFRQKGGSPIIENALRIQAANTKMDTCDDFQVIRTSSPEESLQIVKDLSTKLYNSDDPFETQVLCPARKGVSGILSINKELQAVLNPQKQEIVYGSTRFRLGDKVIMVRNNYAKDYYNGDIGIVKSIKDGGMTVVIRGEDMEISRDLLEDVRLSYGMTIHKSQGSEFKNVIIVLPKEPKNMLVRNLFYTAVTRAKKRVFIITEDNSLEKSITTDTSKDRKTFLGSMLKEMSAV